MSTHPVAERVIALGKQSRQSLMGDEADPMPVEPIGHNLRFEARCTSAGASLVTSKTSEPRLQNRCGRARPEGRAASWPSTGDGHRPDVIGTFPCQRSPARGLRRRPLGLCGTRLARFHAADIGPSALPEQSGGAFDGSWVCEMGEGAERLRG